VAKLRAYWSARWNLRLKQKRLPVLICDNTKINWQASSLTEVWRLKTATSAISILLSPFLIAVAALAQEAPQAEVLPTAPAATAGMSDIKEIMKQADQAGPQKPANDLDETDPETARKLQLLEAHFFGHLYVNDQVAKRVSRLEQFVFGVESGGPFITRLNKVEETLHVKDPDGTKREIPLVRPEPKVNQPSQQPVAPSTEATPAIPDVVNQQQSNPTPGPPPSPAELEKAALSSASQSQPVSSDEPPAQAIPLKVTKERFSPSGKPSEIVRQLDIALRVHPSDADLYFERAKAMIQMDKISAAINDLADAIRNQPNRSEYYLARAWCYKRLGNTYLAEDDIKQARFVNPALPKDINLLPSVESKNERGEK